MKKSLSSNLKYSPRLRNNFVLMDLVLFLNVRRASLKPLTSLGYNKSSSYRGLLVKLNVSLLLACNLILNFLEIFYISKAIYLLYFKYQRTVLFHWDLSNPIYRFQEHLSRNFSWYQVEGNKILLVFVQNWKSKHWLVTGVYSVFQMFTWEKLNLPLHFQLLCLLNRLFH